MENKSQDKYRYDVTKTAMMLKAAGAGCTCIAKTRDDGEITVMQQFSLLVVRVAVSLFIRAFRDEIAP